MTWRARLLAAGQLAVLLGVAIVSMATSEFYNECEPGGWPMPGQSAVPLDAELTLVGHDLPTRGPTIGGGPIRLARIVDGAAIEVPITVSRHGHEERGFDVPTDSKADYRAVTWRIVPDAPLRPDALYRITGIDLEALDVPHVMVDGSENALLIRNRWTDSLSWRALRRYVYTGPGPWLLAALIDGDDGGVATVRLVFSEPVEADRVAERMQITGVERAKVTSARTQGGLPSRVVTVSVSRAVGQGLGGARIVIEPGAPVRGYWPAGGPEMRPLDDGPGIALAPISATVRERRLATYVQPHPFCQDLEPAQ